jgi:hypothetical protein
MKARAVHSAPSRLTSRAVADAALVGLVEPLVGAGQAPALATQASTRPKAPTARSKAISSADRLAHVGQHAQRALAPGLLLDPVAHLGRARVTGTTRLPSRQLLGQGAADAARAAGDEDDVVASQAP